jgi:hypothetical protein
VKKILPVELTKEDREMLEEMARRDERSLAATLRVMIRDAAARRGIVAPPPPSAIAN